MSYKIDLHQSISSSTCLPSAKTVVNSPCQIHGLAFPLFVLILKLIQRRSSTLKLQNKRMSYNGFCTDVFYVLLGGKKERKKIFLGLFLFCYSLSFLLFCFEYQPKPVIVLCFQGPEGLNSSHFAQSLLKLELHSSRI